MHIHSSLEVIGSRDTFCNFTRLNRYHWKMAEGTNAVAVRRPASVTQRSCSGLPASLDICRFVYPPTKSDVFHTRIYTFLLYYLLLSTK